MLKKAGGRVAAFVALMLSAAGFSQADSPVVTVIQNSGDRLLPVSFPEGTVSANTAITAYVREISLEPVPPGSNLEVVSITATIVDPDGTQTQTVDVGVLVTSLTPTVYSAKTTTDIYGVAVTGVIIPGMILRVDPVNNTPVSTISITGGATPGATSRFAIVNRGTIDYAYDVMIKTGSVFDYETEPNPLALFYGYSNNPLDLLPGIGAAAFTVANVNEGGYDGNPQTTTVAIRYLPLKQGQTVSYRVPYDAFNVDSAVWGSEALFSSSGLPRGLTLSRGGLLNGVFSGSPAVFTVRLADAQTTSNFAEKPITIVSAPYNARAFISLHYDVLDSNHNYTVSVLEGLVVDGYKITSTVLSSSDITLGRLLYQREVPVIGAQEVLAPLSLSVVQSFGGVNATLLSTWIENKVSGYDLPGPITIGGDETTLTVGGSEITLTALIQTITRIGVLGRVRYQKFGLDAVLKHGSTLQYAKDTNRMTIKVSRSDTGVVTQTVTIGNNFGPSTITTTLTAEALLTFNAAVSVVVSAAASNPVTAFVPFVMHDSSADDGMVKLGDPSISEIGEDADGVFTVDLKEYSTEGSSFPAYYHFRSNEVNIDELELGNPQNERHTFDLPQNKRVAPLGAAVVSIIRYGDWWPIGCDDGSGGSMPGLCEGSSRTTVYHNNFVELTATLSYMRSRPFGSVAYSRVDLSEGIYTGGGHCLLGLAVNSNTNPPTTTTITVRQDYGGSNVSLNVSGPTAMSVGLLGIQDDPGDNNLLNCYGVYQAGGITVSSAAATLQYTLHIVRNGVTLADHAYDMLLERGLGAGTLTLETNVETSHVYRGFQSVDPQQTLAFRVVGNPAGPIGWVSFNMLPAGLSIVARAPVFDQVEKITIAFSDPADGSAFTATLAFASRRTDVIRGAQTLNVAEGNYSDFIHAAETDTGLSIVIENSSLHPHVTDFAFLDVQGSTAQFAAGLTLDIADLRADGVAAVKVKANQAFPEITFGGYPTIVASIDFDSQSSQLPSQFSSSFRFIFTLRSKSDLNSPPSISYSPTAITLPAITLTEDFATGLTFTVSDLNIETPAVWVSDRRFSIAHSGTAPFARTYGVVAKADQNFSQNDGDIEFTIFTEDQGGARDTLTQTISFIQNDKPVVTATPSGGVTITSNVFNNLEENRTTGATINVTDSIPAQGRIFMRISDDRFTLVHDEAASSPSNFTYDLQVLASSAFDAEGEPAITLGIVAQDSAGAASTLSYTIRVEVIRIEVEKIHKEVLPVIAREIINVNSQHLEDHISTLRPVDDGALVLGLDDGGGVQVVREMLLRKQQGLEEGDLNLAEFIDGQSFALPLAQNASGGVQVGFWGRGDYSAIDQKENDDFKHIFEGDLLSGSLGLEAVSETFAFGVGMGYHSGEFEVRGGVELNDDNDDNWIDYGIDMYTVNPYVAAFLGDAGKAWLAMTYGQGDVDFAEGLACAPGSSSCSTGYDANCPTGSTRCRIEDNGTLDTKGFSIGGIVDLLALTSADAGSLNLKLHYSHHSSEYSNEDGENVTQQVRIEGIENRAARLGLEYEIDIDADGAIVTPSFAAYMRGNSDTASRDAEAKSSSGFESVLGLGFSSAQFPVSFGVKGRFLQVNELSAAGGHLEMAYGASDASGLGLSFSLRPSYGGLGTGEQLFEAAELADLAVPGGGGLRMGSEIAYGMAVPYGLFTPYGSYNVKPDENDEYVLGMNYSHGGFSRIGVSMLGMQGSDAHDLKVEYHLDLQK